MTEDTAIAAAAVAGAAAELAEAAGDNGMSPQEADLERTIVVEEEATKRELARLETELKIAKLQSEKPPWLEELIAQLTLHHETLLSLLTQATLTTQPQPQPQAVAIAAPQETEASGAGAVAETVEEGESGEATPVQPEAQAAEEPPRRRTFSRGI